MSRLRIYTVHINPSIPNPYEEAKFVEEGFNWKAFVFSGLWTLSKTLWLPSIVIIAINAAIASSALAGIGPAGIGCMLLAWNIIIGYLANDWLRSKLKDRGYIIADIVTGDSLLCAEQRFFDRYFSSRENAPAFGSQAHA